MAGEGGISHTKELLQTKTPLWQVSDRSSINARTWRNRFFVADTANLQARRIPDRVQNLRTFSSALISSVSGMVCAGNGFVNNGVAQVVCRIA